MKKNIKLGILVALSSTISLSVGCDSGETKSPKLAHPILAVGYDNKGTPSDSDDSPVIVRISKENDKSGSETFNGEMQTLSGVGRLGNVSCTEKGSKSVCVAVGQTAGTITPLVAISKNAGETWRNISFFQGIQAVATSASCFGSGDTATCAVVGRSTTDKPFLSVTHNSGSTWEQTADSVLPADGYLSSVKCFGETNLATCIATGVDYLNFSGPSTAPLLLVSKDGGDTWSRISTFSSLNASLSVINCSKNAEDRVCIAVGDNEGKPLVLFSTDNAKTWSRASGIPHGTLSSIACTDNGDKCVVAGSRDNKTALLGISSDMGFSWTFPNYGDSTSGQLKSVSCFGVGKAASCVAVGHNGDNSRPLLIFSDGSDNRAWDSDIEMNESVSPAGFNSVSCGKNTDDTATCIAVGTMSDHGLATISFNDVKNWSFISRGSKDLYQAGVVLLGTSIP